jgi:5'(3')-deoxyribonucleotidase
MTEPNERFRVDPGEGPQKAGWIAIDVDGVLAAHVEQILPVLKRHYNFEASFDQIRTWDFHVGETTFGAIIRAEQKSPGFILRTPIVTNAGEAMRTLYASHHIAIVTARPPETDSWTREWLASHDIPYDAYENLRDGEKHQTAMSCDLLVDDYQVNVLAFIRSTQARAILFSRPWNWDSTGLESYLASGRLTRANDWREVLSLISSLLTGTEATITND